MNDPAVLALRNALSSDNFWILASTFAVVVGVVVELVELLLFNKDMRPIQRRILFVGTVLVILGCGGEFVFESKASTVEAQLQQLSDEKVAALGKDEAEDKRIAVEAAKQAAQLGVKVDTLPTFVTQKEAEIDGQIRTFQSFASTAKRRDDATIAKLNKAMADLNKTRSDVQAAAEAAEALVATASKQFRARGFTKEQEKAFASAVKGASGDLAVFSLASDPEGYTYATEITRLLKEAGINARWGTMPITQYFTNKVGEPELILYENTGNAPGNPNDGLVEKLAAAFKAAGQPITVERSDDPGSVYPGLYVAPHAPVLRDSGP